MATSDYATRRHAVLITGGSDGIGLGLARRYLDGGHRVIVTGRRDGRLRAAAAAHPGLETFASDIGSPEARETLAAHIADVMPELDTIVNNAGVQRRVPLADDDEPWAEVRAEIEILFEGPMHLNRLLLPLLLRADRDVLIIDVTSGGAYMPQTFAPVYSASKAALHSYSVNLRWALAETRIGVTELIPPAVATSLAGDSDRHGADLGEFCDAVFPLLDGSRDEVGFGATASDLFRDLLERQNELFLMSAGRSPTRRYRPGRPRDRDEAQDASA
ncbi:SDR family NAD(P)-dependent oxidoreductase [Microbacterium sp. SORGH_AS_0888]|uniref:SDR family NAD(P)-dependent oxidoreductase n=1 Tax=Microbacterium sp. SORGH_AS_0888 TaxID=3041791 RepID=UPI0027895B2A|nr:SDR family NAD(P)-dependent oxidoreductase [Microbacterium sp. SORGH_AS_0888]MDQ1131228.1 putative oxidoreductase [Microbacterium sp. SORGH_AS_0888]